MVPIKYTAVELLKLKGSQMSQIRLNQLKSNSDFDIIKQTPNVPQHCASKAKDENVSSATDSEDHIVFQGKKARHPIGSLGGETEWKYRARTMSDRNSSEPVDAPAGLDAQRSEGFQRFFKAVVSPTHVRVTAGGRIVPNTRNTTSPTAKWDKEQSTVENENDTLENDTAGLPKQSASENVANQATQQNGHGLTHMMMPPPTPWYPCFPPMPPIYAHGPMPLYPLPHPMAMPIAMPQAPPNMAFVPHHPAFQGHPQAVHKPVEGNDGDMGSKKPRPAPIKIVPHDQFEQMQMHPCYPTGGFQMPITAPMGAGMHGHMAPLGNDAGDPAHQITTAHGATFNHRPSMTSIAPAAGDLVTEGAVKSMATENAVKPVAEYNPSLFVPMKTPVTSIKPSQITKAQLASLRSSLKFYVDQIQYNRHQIDEKATQDQINTIRNLIIQFERSYKLQVDHELHGITREKRDPAALSAKPGFKGYKTPPTPMNPLPAHGTDQALTRGNAANPSGLSRMKSSDHLRRKNFRDLRQRAGINCSKTLDTTAALSDLEKDLREKMEKRGTPLPVFSATTPIGPIFEPRGVAQMPPIAEANYPEGSFYSQPYLVGRLPKGMDPLTARDTAYIYPRELNENEKRARHVYWGGVSVKGSGLPKFDGKDFYPSSPVVSAAEMQPNARGTETGPLDLTHFPELPKKSDDPFQTGRDTLGPVPKKTNKKFSHAVPIINPKTLARENIATTAANVCKATPVADDLEGAPNSPTGDEQSASSRRTLDRSSKSSSNDLWQGVMKKASAIHSMIPAPALANASVTSTTAQGYVQEYLDQAASSLCPSINANGNANGNMRGSSSDKSDAEAVRQQTQTEKMDENCRPPKKPTTQDEIIADLHQRVFRDAERRGVINPRRQ